MTDFDFLSHRKLGENFYVVCEQFNKEGYNFNIYVVIGTEKVAIFDSGCGVTQGMRKYIEENLSGDKPIACYVTHVDLDHMGGADLFDEVHMSYKDLNKLDWNLNVERRFSDLEYFCHGDQAVLDYCRDRYVRNENIREKLIDIKDGEIIDVGGEQLVAIPLMGHTPGSMAFYNKARNYCLTGDGTSPTGSFQRCRDMEECLREYENLAEILPMDCTLYDAHTLTTQTHETLDNLIACMKEVLAWDNEGDEPCFLPFKMVDPEELEYDVWAHSSHGVRVPYDRKVLPPKKA